MTLNVLLSFAQFEREVTAERIRDKIAASKKRGMWMGGPVPLGYDSVEKKLVINITDTHDEVTELIKYRSYDLYGYTGPGDALPVKPTLYDDLCWADPLPAVKNPIGVIAARMKRAPRSRTTISARELG